ncbi:D-isomer specific 2-hydroxyacid dehydrogenase family protein [Aquihabitans daechungensis]|uniref:D-isomer specific 2-hydroxyacid dehydrogenase family protein n=1 Tax=Aquihabitans daechungensis TaxID=1052257 RepID=UPI003BA22175
MAPRGQPAIATAPVSARWIDAAVTAGGAELVPPERATAVVWTQADDPDGLAALLDANPQINWVQLPWAGIEPYIPLLGHDRTWTCAKGVYADPVAEHALALLLAGFRNLHAYASAETWTGQVGRNLLDARVTIIGGGGIAEALIGLLVPFRCSVTVVRQNPGPMPGVDRVLGSADRLEALEGADAVVLALPLLPSTHGLIGPDELAAMEEHAWLVNVARGAHVRTDALVDALASGAIGGAALDVTDPEPLPDGHPLWSLPNAIITPHTGNTKAMARPLLGARITDNVRRYAAGAPFVGLVDVDAGY